MVELMDIDDASLAVVPPPKAYSAETRTVALATVSPKKFHGTTAGEFEMHFDRVVVPYLDKLGLG
jgi:hypothetical protein